MNWRLFASTFSFIFIAELPDKTAFATLLMATRSNPLGIFSGAAAAFAVQSLVAVVFGKLISLAPQSWVHLAAGLLFIGFAIVSWRRSNISDEEHAQATYTHSFAKSAWKSFSVIFIAEWGDMTQLATASLVAQYGQPLTVFVASTVSLWCTAAVAVIAGRKLKHAINAQLVDRIASFAFGAAGLYFIVEAARHFF